MAKRFCEFVGVSRTKLDGILCNFILDDFLKSQIIQSSLKCAQNIEYFIGRTLYIFDHVLLSTS